MCGYCLLWGFDDFFDDLRQTFVWLLLLVVDRWCVYLLVVVRCVLFTLGVYSVESAARVTSLVAVCLGRVFCSPPSPPLVGRVLGASCVLVATCLVVAGSDVLGEGEHCCANAPLTGELRL